MAMVYKGVSEKTTLDVLALRKLAAKDALLFPANNVSDCMRKPELNNVYGCRYPLVNDKRGLVNDKRGLVNDKRDGNMADGRRTLVCGSGDVSEGCAFALRGASARVPITELLTTIIVLEFGALGTS
jgi:adenosylhomocysteinase